VQVVGGEQRGQAVEPAPEEAGDRAGTEPVADPLQQHRVLARGEPVVQGGEPDAGLGQLPLGPFVTVEPLRCRRDYAEFVGMADSGFVQVVLVLPVLSA
jgi:hypothetical protein